MKSYLPNGCDVLKKLIITNTYYQVIFAIQLKMTMFQQDSVVLIVSDHSKNSKLVAGQIANLHLFEDVVYVESLDFINKKSVYDSALQFIDTCFWDGKKYDFYSKKLDNFCFDELLCYNLGRDVVGLFALLSKENHNLRLSLFEEGILSYNTPILYTKKRKVIDFVRLLLRKTQFIKAFDCFYCFYPELYKGELNKAQVPLIEEGSETVKMIQSAFNFINDADDYSEKYIFFTSVFDFEGEHPIGEYELACKIAKIVGKDNLLIKTHPRDRRTVYSDNGFKVDKNSSIPWEAIQLSGDFGDKVFLTASSGSVLSGSFMSSHPPKTYYLYKLCNIDGNKMAEESRRNIDELLSNKDMHSVFSRLKAVNTIEEIFD